METNEMENEWYGNDSVPVLLKASEKPTALVRRQLSRPFLSVEPRPIKS